MDTIKYTEITIKEQEIKIVDAETEKAKTIREIAGIHFLNTFKLYMVQVLRETIKSNNVRPLTKAINILDDISPNKTETT